MNNRIIAAVLVLVLALGVAGPAWALGTEVDTGALVVMKLFRGIMNAATGWMEIPKQMSVTWQASGAGVGSSWGFIKGIGFAVARSVAGAYEIVTFPLPIPDGYRPIMQPEYVISDISGGSATSKR